MQAIITKYYGPTNSRGSRIRATAGAGSVSIPVDNAGSIDWNHREAARALALKFDWTGIYTEGGLPDGSRVWVCANGNADRFEIVKGA